VPVCLWVFFVQDRHAAAIVLAIYCGGVSMLEYYIKPLVLHGRSNLHPLLALLSVLGGVQALGPIGIIVGPMAVAFLQTLLEMVNKEMAAWGKGKKGEIVGALEMARNK
jgi:predicted PurR-regulated permease PerM